MNNNKGNIIIKFIYTILIMFFIYCIVLYIYNIYNKQIRITDVSILENIALENAEINIENNMPTIFTNYYYEQLNDYGKKIYDELKKNKEKLVTGTYIFDFKTEFNTLLHSENGIEQLEIAFQSAWDAFSYDECDLFYLDIKKVNLMYEKHSLAGISTYYVSIGPTNNSNYLQENFQTQQEIEKAKEYIDNIVVQIIEQTKNDTDIDKIKKVHNWLINVLEYDNLENANRYNIYGALHDKKAVCEGYARTFKYLMKKLKIPCVIVYGIATNSEEITESHAWNYVQIDNEWYAIDVTWDDPIIKGSGLVTNDIKYKYFLKGSNDFFKDHTEKGKILNNGIEFTFPTLSTQNY